MYKCGTLLTERRRQLLRVCHAVLVYLWLMSVILHICIYIYILRMTFAFTLVTLYSSAMCRVDAGMDLRSMWKRYDHSRPRFLFLKIIFVHHWKSTCTDKIICWSRRLKRIVKTNVNIIVTANIQRSIN